MGGGAETKTARAKLSTTVSQQTSDFLEQMVDSGEASSIGDAVDRAVAKVRAGENRRRLAEATARYFAQMDKKDVPEEDALGHDMSVATGEIDFDTEL